jgi:predicted metal-dependent peptidase
MDALQQWLDGFTREASFLAKYPYYAAVLAKLVPVADPSVSSMAVSFEGQTFYLHVNVEYFVRAPQYVRGILLHEVHHVVLGHLTHPKFFGVEHAALMELAKEMSANEHIAEPLPNPITIAQFESAGIRRGQSTIDRYEKLVPLARGRQPRVIGENIDTHLFTKPKPPPGGVEITRQLIESARDQIPEDETNPLLAGRDPGRLLEDLVGIQGPPEVTLDWRAALSAFVAHARAPVHTWARPSRRFPDQVGRVPGRIWVPRPILRPALLVAIDTSMSMTDRELSEISRQLSRVAEHARITIAECDVEVTRVYAFDGAIAKVKGRGGTDLRPVFELLPGYDGVVYFTDGQGPFPADPPAVPVLWVLTKPHDFECPFGERAKMELPRR